MGAAAGPVIIFVMSVVALAIWGLPTFTYAAHSFLTVWIETANGRDRFRWPSGENIMDWLWKPVFLLFVLAFWAIFGLFVIGPFFFAHPAAFIVFYPIFLVCIFPISLYSTMQAQNFLVLFYPPLMLRMIQRPFSFVAIALFGLLPVALALVMTYGILAWSAFMILPAAIVWATAVLFYARIWGCYGYLIFEGLGEQHRPRNKKRKSELKMNQDVPAPVGGSAKDPWNDPDGAAPELEVEELDDDEAPKLQETAREKVEEEEDEWTPNKKPYLFMDEAKPYPERTFPVYEGEQGSYEIGDVKGEEIQETPTSMDKYYKERRRLERERNRRADDSFLNFGQGKESALYLLTTGVVPFLGYDTTLRAFINLGFLFLFELFFLYLAILFFPRG